MKPHHFVVVATGGDPDADETYNAFYEAGCDDATVTWSDGAFELTFSRKANHVAEAVTSACLNVTEAGATVMRIIPCKHHYHPRHDKIAEGVLRIHEISIELTLSLTQPLLSIVMFLADKMHLDSYGRPVFFENYVAGLEGISGEATAEMMAEGYDWSRTGHDDPAWTIDNSEQNQVIRPLRTFDGRRLSQTDQECLHDALVRVQNFGAEGACKLILDEPAYRNAIAIREGVMLDPLLIPTNRDDDTVEMAIYASKHAYVAPRRRNGEQP